MVLNALRLVTSQFSIYYDKHRSKILELLRRARSYKIAKPRTAHLGLRTCPCPPTNRLRAQRQPQRSNDGKTFAGRNALRNLRAVAHVPHKFFDDPRSTTSHTAIGGAQSNTIFLPVSSRRQRRRAIAPHLRRRCDHHERINQTHRTTVLHHSP